MFKNLHIKFIALLLSTLFWIFVVSLQNTFYEFPEKVAVQVFNQSADLALASDLGFIMLTLRADDSVLVRKLSVNDFEAYVDLRNVGAGIRNMPISVTSKNPQVSVIRTVPSEIEIDIQPVKRKVVSLSVTVHGAPAKGFSLENATVDRNTVTVTGADDLLKKIDEARVDITLDGSEKTNLTKMGGVRVFDLDGKILENVVPEFASANVDIFIVETESEKQVGVRPQFKDSPMSGTVKSVEVLPAVVTVSGKRENLDALKFLLTEEISLKNVDASFEKEVLLVLPEGIAMAEGEGNRVKVKVGVEVDSTG